jgi:hypothetical protein
LRCSCEASASAVTTTTPQKKKKTAKIESQKLSFPFQGEIQEMPLSRAPHRALTRVQRAVDHFAAPVDCAGSSRDAVGNSYLKANKPVSLFALIQRLILPF